MYSETAKDLTLYFVAWFALFLAFRMVLFRRFSATFSNVAVSWVHAMFALRLGSLAVNWRHPLSQYGTSTTPAQLKVLTVSLAYFTYDSICCELIKHDLPNLLHHLATIAGLLVGVLQLKSGPELTVCLVLMEMSSPCLHNRAIFKELGMKDSGLALLNDIAFALTFFVCRLVIGPFVTWTALQTPSTSMIVKVGATGVQIVSVFWAYQIFSVVRHQAKKRSAARTAKSE